MRVLLDTHVLLWMAGRSRRLSPAAREVLSDGDNELLFNIAGYWEPGIKNSIGKLELATGWEEALPKEIASNGISWNMRAAVAAILRDQTISLVPNESIQRRASSPHTGDSLTICRSIYRNVFPRPERQAGKKLPSR